MILRISKKRKYPIKPTPALYSRPQLSRERAMKHQNSDVEVFPPPACTKATRIPLLQRTDFAAIEPKT